ncbi:MAG: ABC transporter substrate-binding protein [Deltaproteobacteria bacterium]|nr:ABC transporter substrate-binding protein [Deltaproteobacteria bacterium]NIS78043.1 ABC transporter substrate-binding protein [Deltaproteobacteria bacterium]
MAKRARFLLIPIIFLLLTPAAAPGSRGPTDQVRETVDRVIELLKDKEMDSGKRRQMLSSLIRKRFEFRIMSQQVLATNWKKANPDERDRFVTLFSDLLENTYMERIEAYTDEKVEYVNEKVRDDRAIVETIIVTKTADIPIRYKLVMKGDEWLVYDVVIEEVSLIRNYRSSYREIVMKDGIEGLLARMEEKVKEMNETSKKAEK